METNEINMLKPDPLDECVTQSMAELEEHVKLLESLELPSSDFAEEIQDRLEAFGSRLSRLEELRPRRGDLTKAEVYRNNLIPAHIRFLDNEAKRLEELEKKALESTPEVDRARKDLQRHRTILSFLTEINEGGLSHRLEEMKTKLQNTQSLIDRHDRSAKDVRRRAITLRDQLSALRIHLELFSNLDESQGESSTDRICLPEHLGARFRLC